jgi:hypothetical protein
MLPFILTVFGGYFIGSALRENEDVSIFADGGNINDNLWESVKNKFSNVFFEEGYGDEIYSNQVKAEEYKWLFDRYSKYSSSLSWEDAEDKFLDMLTPEEKNIIKIEHNIVDSHELFGIMSEKKILVKRIMAKGGQIGDSARVIETNKSGVIMEKMGKKYLLKFVDGTEGTYDAKELEFTKQFKTGGQVSNDIEQIEIEVEKIDRDELLLEVELKYYDDTEEKFYFEYEIDRDSDGIIYSLPDIFDSNKNKLKGEKLKEIESNRYLNDVLENAVDDAIESYFDEDESDYESDYYKKGGKIRIKKYRKSTFKDGGGVSKNRINYGDVVRIKNPYPDEDESQLYVVVQDTSEYNEEDQIDCQVIGEKWESWHFKPVSRIEMKDLEVVVTGKRIEETTKSKK